MLPWLFPKVTVKLGAVGGAQCARLIRCQSGFPVARLQPPKCCVLRHSKEPDGCRANCSPPRGAAHRTRALSTAVLGTSGEAAYGCCASALSQRHSVG